MTLPVVQAPVGGAATPELAAAVSGAGGLGTLAGSWTRPDRLRTSVRQVQPLTSGRSVSTSYCSGRSGKAVGTARGRRRRRVHLLGDPTSFVEDVYRAGALHVHAVGSAEEARRAVAAGVDAVVAQGWEAGGHVLGTVSTLALVPAVVDAVAPVPVLAAGGIADGRGLAAVLALGAEAAWIGTRFVASPEADAHPDYQACLIDAVETSTVFSTLFDGGWPDASHRTLHNSTALAWEIAGGQSSARPGEHETVAVTSNGAVIRRYSSDLPTRAVTGDVEAMALYAGQGVGVLREIMPAARIAQQLTRDALERLADVHAARRRNT